MVVLVVVAVMIYHDHDADDNDGDLNACVLLVRYETQILDAIAALSAAARIEEFLARDEVEVQVTCDRCCCFCLTW
jgi:hypothetical protein